jgi:hypothetical protein
VEANTHMKRNKEENKNIKKDKYLNINITSCYINLGLIYLIYNFLFKSEFTIFLYISKYFNIKKENISLIKVEKIC